MEVKKYIVSILDGSEEQEQLEGLLQNWRDEERPVVISVKKIGEFIKHEAL